MRKSDIPPPVSYREYLNMDTDEEEFGIQETPEPDEESLPELKKLIFTEEELKTIVEYVRNMSLVPNSDEFIISDESIDIIHEYFCNPSHKILTIFYELSEYKALLHFPHYYNHGLIYFLRLPWQIYTVDNFLSTIIYGNFNGKIENSVLKFLENIYAPITFNTDEWPKVTKYQIVSNLNEFLISLTDVTYKPMGFAILYVPLVEMYNIQINNDSIISNNIHHSIDNYDNTMIERFEKIAHHWIKQIRDVLCGVDTLSKSVYNTIIDESQFWNNRFENLCCLQSQLSSEYVIAIVRILDETKSSSITDFHSLVNEINMMLSQADSNITYLNILVHHCHDFEIPNGMANYARKILLLIRFVGIESKFYNTTDKMEVLCRALGTQIIIQCQKQVKLEIIFEDDPQIGKTILEGCINCCKHFMTIFHQMIIMDRISNITTFSKIDEKNVFCHVNTFIQRCQDLIEVIDARIVFDKCQNVIIIGGTRALDYNLQYKKIQKLFYDALNDIKRNSDCILDVSVFTWLEKILNFRCHVENIDNMMNNLIHNLFDDVENVEEGLEMLYCMRRFTMRKQLHKILHEYWTLIWNLFDDELNNIIVNVNINTDVYTELEHFPIDRVTLLGVKKNYLRRLYNMLIDASDWFHDNMSVSIIEKYKSIYQSLLQKENTF